MQLLPVCALALTTHTRKATTPCRIPTPHVSCPVFLPCREDNARKRKSDREATKTRRPDPGMVAGRGKQGRIGATGGTLLTQHLLKQVRGSLR